MPIYQQQRKKEEEEEGRDANNWAGWANSSARTLSEFPKRRGGNERSVVAQ